MPSVLQNTQKKDIPTLSPWRQLTNLRSFRHDQLAFLAESFRRYGDIFRMRVLGVPIVAVNHPDFVQRILVDNRENYDKETFLYRAVRPVLRNGLIGAVGGESWHRQRRLMQPSFHRHKIAVFTGNMTEELAAMMDRWDRQYAPQDVASVLPEISHVVLRIVTRTLFGADAGSTSEALERDFTAANEVIGRYFQFPFPPLNVPTPYNRRLGVMISNLHKFVGDLIARRDQSETTLLGILSDAVDADTGHRMDAEQLRDEVVNLMIGGYETTTNSIAHLLNLLVSHQDVQDRLHAEVTGVVGDRIPTFEDIGKLQYTRMVVDETFRLSTPAWQTMRRSVGDDEIGGHHLPAKTGVYINFLLMHRHPDFWPDPERFDPERFSPQNAASRPKHAYIPFASGPRHCIGKHFALTELTVFVALLAQRFRIRRPAGAPPREYEQLITLRPKHGVQLHLERR
jgi:cytochrome P450